MNGAFRRVATRVPTAAFNSTLHGQVTLPGATRCFTNVPSSRSSEADEKAKSLNKKAADEAERQVTARDDAQRKVDDRPWQREETGEHSQPPASSPDPAKGDESRGRLLTTPTRLLKLILPLPFHPDQVYINPEKKADQKYGSEKVEPLALLVHPQQPLSYLERLIQAEIPPLQVKGNEKLPGIVFRAEADREVSEGKKGAADNVASYSGLGHEAEKSDEEKNWVRWSGSTEVGDFIRDAARGREFAIDIEGHDGELRVAVPSFKDRTYYMRMRLRRMSRQINSMAELKKECDMLAHKGAHRIAQSGFGALVTWWGVVYYVTFHTEMGWDLVEPVTYLAGLTTIMGGYLWFLYMSRDLSYKAAMNVTVSRRQSALYQERGLDHGKWEHAVQEANALRREIKAVAAEYDAEWDEMKDLGGEEVKEALEQEKEGKDEKDDKQAKQDAADKAKQSE
ncbi:uncharacterized protein J7T54_001407 [Emericellopsis cladophorae]|uniref:Calcium uniporter protein n=1 Tax=Emericellopsis cladophorae TaxID=2686198 RepID=A0A9Q0BEB8_9HYPO|nr:uncharacterized protein J7T54_001407 [Emericellopsis cladophorae]KAI6781445.1 hypothetical protein J7T54_001407 [Emericellopsis cladophorae]